MERVFPRRQVDILGFDLFEMQCMGFLHVRLKANRPDVLHFSENRRTEHLGMCFSVY